MNLPLRDECTSLACASTFILGGFADGTVRLWDWTGRYERPSMSQPLEKGGFVNSQQHQTYGAVAAQIHAKGVHTSLRMHVGVAGDYCFAGVLRGSMELVALHVDQAHKASNILDAVTVFRHSDAKLRGFGACTQVSEDKYLLLTGKAIKNIHIWSFEPSLERWTQLYDTQTNGNTITYLAFRNDWQALSKSDGQKLRVWDLSSSSSSNRPPHADIAHSESALALVNQDYLICGGGPDSYNQLSVVSLLAPPAHNCDKVSLPSTHKRGRRGDLNSLVQVASVDQNVVLEVSNGSLWHYDLAQLKPLSLKAGTALAVGKVQGHASVLVATFDPTTCRGSIQIRPLDSHAQLVDPWNKVATEKPMEKPIKKKKKKKRSMEDDGGHTHVERKQSVEVKPVEKPCDKPVDRPTIEKENHRQPSPPASVVKSSVPASVLKSSAPATALKHHHNKAIKPTPKVPRHTSIQQTPSVHAIPTPGSKTPTAHRAVVDTPAVSLKKVRKIVPVSDCKSSPHVPRKRTEEPPTKKSRVEDLGEVTRSLCQPAQQSVREACIEQRRLLKQWEPPRSVDNESEAAQSYLCKRLIHGARTILKALERRPTRVESAKHEFAKFVAEIEEHKTMLLHRQAMEAVCVGQEPPTFAYDALWSTVTSCLSNV